jgi:excisionase family DNA binding protein
MALYSTRQAAKKLGIGVSTLSQYISRKKIPAPQTVRIGDLEVHSWSEEEIEQVRKLLPKIANGRKTRYRKKQLAVSAQQSVKGRRKTQARVPAPHKKK